MSSIVENYLKGVLALVAAGVVTAAVGTLILVVHNLLGSLPS